MITKKAANLVPSLQYKIGGFFALAIMATTVYPPVTTTYIANEAMAKIAFPSGYKFVLNLLDQQLFDKTYYIYSVNWDILLLEWVAILCFAVVSFNWARYRKHTNTAAVDSKLNSKKKSKNSSPNHYFNLGISYAEGDGVKVDYVKAFINLSIAECLGHTSSTRSKESLASKMHPAQLMHAKQQAEKIILEKFK